MQRPVVIVFIGLLAPALVLTALGALWSGTVAKSLLLGCLIFALPSLYFTVYAFRYQGERAIALMVRSFNWGQASKLSLVALGFALVFTFVKPLHTPALFVGFCLMIPAQILVAMFVSKNYSDPASQ